MNIFSRTLILYSILTLCGCVNYIYNGGFELPLIADGSDIFEGAIGWNGSTYQLMNKYRKLGHNQYIDLSGLYQVNGYI